MSGNNTGGSYVVWTVDDVAFMRRNANRGLEWIAEQLHRSPKSVERAAARHKISLRKKGERRGRPLGMPRNMTFADLRRMGVAHPERLIAIDMNAAHDRLVAVVEGKAERLCPACGTRPIETTVGWCTKCWTDSLEAQHRDETDRIRATKALDAARQEKQRAKR